MRQAVLFLAVLLVPALSKAGIATDAGGATVSASIVSSGTVGLLFKTGAGPTILVAQVSLQSSGPSDFPSTVTWNGSNMTQLRTQTGTHAGGIYINQWIGYYLNPGNSTSAYISATVGTTAIVNVGAESYSGSDPFHPWGSNSTVNWTAATGNANNFSTSYTNSWVLDFITGWIFTSFSFGTGTQRFAIFNSNGMAMADQATTSTGSYESTDGGSSVTFDAGIGDMEELVPIQPTATPTFTKTPTWSPTSTITKTATQTATGTWTATATKTWTQTWTPTPSPTWTSTSSPTSTTTPTWSPTISPTWTVSPTPTNTITPGIPCGSIGATYYPTPQTVYNTWSVDNDVNMNGAWLAYAQYGTTANFGRTSPARLNPTTGQFWTYIPIGAPLWFEDCVLSPFQGTFCSCQNFISGLPTPTITLTSTVSPTPFYTFPPAPTSTFSPFNTYTLTPTQIPTATWTASPVLTPTPTATPFILASNTISPTITISPTETPIASPTQSATPTATATPFIFAGSPTATPTVTPTITKTATLTPTPTFTPTWTKTSTTTATPTNTP